MRLPQLKAVEFIFLFGLVLANVVSAQEQTKAPDSPSAIEEVRAPVVPSEIRDRVIVAQKKISDLNVQLLQLQRQAEQQGTQLSAQLDAAVKEGQTACGDEKKWVFDRDSRTCKTVTAPQKASGPPTPETQAKR